jgi:hypothetical protein
MGVYQVCSNNSLGVNIGHAPGGVIACPYMYIVINLNKKLLLKKRAGAKIFGIKHYLISGYQVCSNKNHGVKIGPVPGGSLFFP